MQNQQLVEHAAALGSDCPFFLEAQPAYTFGRGTTLIPFSLDLKGWFIVLVHPGVHSSTSEAYRNVPKRKAGERGTDLRELLKQPVEEWRQHVVNDFETSVFAELPVCRRIKEELYRAGAGYASMSGSGSSVFGLFRKLPVLNKELQTHVVYAGLL
jgi:4-diphosphocytidyl-2-C-methyl-D-erythritol kinase